MLTSSQEVILKNELSKESYASLLAARDYNGIALLLNAPVVVDNPDDTPTTPLVEITLKMLLAYVPPAEAAKIYAMGEYVVDLKTAIDSGDRDYMAYLLSVAVAGNAISQQTAATLQPLLSATVTVPAPATISEPGIAEELGLPVITAGDVQLVSHRYLGA